MTEIDVVDLFIKYVVILAPILVPILAITLVSSWVYKLVEVMSGKGW